MKIIIAFTLIILTYSGVLCNPIDSPWEACTPIHSSYNLATNKAAYITCNNTMLDPNAGGDYGYYYATLTICTPALYNAGYPYSWWTCFECDNSLDWSGDGPYCTITIESGQYITSFGLYTMRLNYWAKELTYPSATKSVANITILNDTSFQCPLGQAYQKNMYCENCTIGTYSANGTSCAVCPLGTTGTTIGATACMPCAPGHYGSGSSTACAAAPPGYYSPGGVFRSSACAPGTYSITSGSAACNLCPAGTTSCAGATSCTPCPAGKISAAGSYSCTPCPPGTYAANSGSTACVACPANSYSTVLAATSSSSCILCPTNTTLGVNCAYSPNCCQ